MSIFLHDDGKWHDHPANPNEAIPLENRRTVGWKRDPYPPREDMCKKCFYGFFSDKRDKELDNDKEKDILTS